MTIKSDRIEIERLLQSAASRGFSPIGLIFYDEKTKLLGLAPLERVPDQFVKQIGKRLGDLPDKPWMPIA